MVRFDLHITQLHSSYLNRGKQSNGGSGGDQKDIHKHHHGRYVQRRPVGFHQQRRASSLAKVPSMLPAPPAATEKGFGGRVFCHSAHTRPSMRGENHFFGGRKTTRPKTGRRPQQKTNGAREPKRNRKAPSWVTAGKTPNKKQEQRGSQVSGLRGQQPQPAQKQPRPCRRKGPRRQRGRRGAGHP